MQIIFDPAVASDVEAVMRVINHPPLASAAADDTLADRAGVELDANGTPWIEAVHAGTKSMKADGTWTKKRGVDDDALAAAEEAARAKIAGTPDAPDLPPVTDDDDTVPPIEMSELVSKFQEARTAGAITPEAFIALYEQFGTSPADIAVNESARRSMFDHLCDLMTKPGLPGL